MDEEQESGWQLTESDPGVFSELLHLLGTPLMMDELYTLDASTLTSDPLSAISPIVALVFLFKWTAEREGQDVAVGEGERGPKTGGVYTEEFNGFFAKQVVNNACATLAIVNALGNIPDLKVGDALGNIFSFGAGMDPWTLGEVLTSSSDLRTIHNSLSPPPAISLDGLDLPKGEAQEAYHFVVYLPVGDKLYELDGLKRLPVLHGELSASGNWVEKAAEVIQRRIEMYPAGAIEFNLQALRYDPLPTLTEALSSSSPSSSLPPHLSVQDAQDLLHTEQQKKQRWHFENALRRHNHLGLAIGLLNALAKVSVAQQASTSTSASTAASGDGEGEAASEGQTANSLWDKTVEEAKAKMKERVERRREMLAMAGKGGASGTMPGGLDEMDLDG